MLFKSLQRGSNSLTLWGYIGQRMVELRLEAINTVGEESFYNETVWGKIV